MRKNADLADYHRLFLKSLIGENLPNPRFSASNSSPQFP
jgi:hypothetical protein